MCDVEEAKLGASTHAWATSPEIAGRERRRSWHVGRSGQSRRRSRGARWRFSRQSLRTGGELLLVADVGRGKIE
jgi:hypothetical protein